MSDWKNITPNHIQLPDDFDWSQFYKAREEHFLHYFDGSFYKNSKLTIAPAPKPNPYIFFEPLAESAFNAYGDAAEWLTWDKKPMPKWSDVGEEIQYRWMAAVKDVIRNLQLRDGKTGELLVP